MSEVSLQIDGKEVVATEDMTVLDAATSAGISIPTVCHHEKDRKSTRLNSSH